MIAPSHVSRKVPVVFLFATQLMPRSLQAQEAAAAAAKLAEEKVK